MVGLYFLVVFDLTNLLVRLRFQSYCFFSEDRANLRMREHILFLTGQTTKRRGGGVKFLTNKDFLKLPESRQALDFSPRWRIFCILPVSSFKLS